MQKNKTPILDIKLLVIIFMCCILWGYGAMFRLLPTTSRRAEYPEIKPDIRSSRRSFHLLGEVALAQNTDRYLKSIDDGRKNYLNQGMYRFIRMG